MSKTNAWKRLREDTIDALDIREVYTEWGVKFTGRVSGKGWSDCHAFGREDKSPSAGVNLATGTYKDFAGETLSIFDFAARHGLFESWEEAQRELAKRAGLGKRIPKKVRPDRAKESLEFTRTWQPLGVRELCKYCQCTPEIVQATGARIARYPAKSPEPQIVVAFPVFSPQALLDEPAESFVLQSGNLRPVLLYRGKDSPPEPHKRLLIGHTGILNEFALRNWESAERVYKVEGVSDMLALQALIPDDLREKHVVITNAAGASDVGPAWAVSRFCSGKEVVIIHDADRPGQDGAAGWVKALTGNCKSVRNAKLPYEIGESHGTDLLDWIKAGHSYADLCGLVENAEAVASPASNGQAAENGLTEEQQILKRLNVIVLGHNEDDRILAFDANNTRLFSIRNIGRYTYEEMLLHMGKSAAAEIDVSEDPDPSKLDVRSVRRAFAREANSRRCQHTNQLGRGIWEYNGRLILVGCGEWLMVNGGIEVHAAPEVGDQLIEFGERGEEWYDLVKLREYWDASTNVDWCHDAFDAAANVFSQWSNWRYARTPELMAALVACSWLQTVWSWRPYVSILGSSNCGKSTLFKVLAAMFGPMALSHESSSEPGVRQDLSNTARVMLLDEFESSAERPKILNWLRNTGRGGSKAVGTPGQRVMKSRIRHLPWFAGTEAELRHEVDRNRYIILHMDPTKSRDLASRLPKPNELRDIGTRMMVLGMRYWKKAAEIAEALTLRPLSDLSERGVDDSNPRVLESYGLPVSLLAAIAGMDPDQAFGLLCDILRARTEELTVQQEDETESILHAILSSDVITSRGDRETVAYLLSKCEPDFGSFCSKREALARVGIMKIPADRLLRTAEARKYATAYESDHLFVCNRVVSQKLLRDTDYRNIGIDQMLVRITGAFRDRRYADGALLRGVSVPLLSITNTYDEQIEDGKSAAVRTDF